MSTTVSFFPFDLFGSRGAGAGAELLADAVREMLADNKREQLPTRARAYAGQVRLREFGFETPAAYHDWRRQGRRAVRDAWKRGDFLCWMAGNHLGVLPVYDELSGDNDTLVVQFDAHLDVYHLSDCTSELSHGNFLMHCAGPLPALVNLGHRELLLPPEHVGAYYRATFPASALAVDPEPALAYLRRAGGEASRVFLDLDCDVFDRAYFPAVAHPVPFGLSPHLLLRLLDAVWSERVVGLAVSEFDPARDSGDHCLATLVWLLEYLLLKRYEGRPATNAPPEGRKRLDRLSDGPSR
ncbi:MAG TPA: arginase family protein [Gemmataceae bacterium]|nr:arginase family protein [Gemmataceae bacterium]